MVRERLNSLFGVDYEKDGSWGALTFVFRKSPALEMIPTVLSIDSFPQQVGIGRNMMRQFGCAVGEHNVVHVKNITNEPTRMMLDSQGVYGQMFKDRLLNLDITDKGIIDRLVMAKLMIYSGFSVTSCNLYVPYLSPSVDDLSRDVFIDIVGRSSDEHKINGLDHVLGIARVRAYISSPYNTGW